MTQAPNVLIVEDEVLIAMYVEMELKQAGYEVSQNVLTGEEAVMIAKQNPPDAILMDIRLAGEIDGIDAARQIQDFCQIPIIFMTGYPDKDAEERARAINPLGFFTKPVSMYAIKPLLDSITTADEGSV